jgi:copper(I)-binding protein
VSSAEQNLITRLRLLPVVLGIGAALVVSGCSAGQITQTDTQVPAVNGSMGTVKQIAVRDMQLAYPTGKRFYSRGDSASVIVTIANSGETSDKLTAVSSPQFSSGGQIVGDATIPAHHAITAKATTVSPLTTTATSTTSTSATATSTTGTSTTGTSTTGTSTMGTSTTGTSTSGASTSTSAVPTSTASVPPLQIGTVQITLVGLNLDKLQAGQTVQVTLTFANAGDLTLTVPIAADPAPRVDN